MNFDVIIIGGGAAGLFCGIEAGKRGRKVLVIENNAQVGRKILISGGGRCNFTNLEVSAENFVSNNPHFCKSALARYIPENFIDLVKKHHIKYYEKTLGQLFCKESSRLIVGMLLAESERAGVTILTDCSAKNIEKNQTFELETNKGKFTCESLVIATGGLSFPKIGATDFGYKVATQFGIKLTNTRPSLVPLVFASGKNYSKLSGISIDASAEFENETFRENILFTHRGLSGPAVLQISNYWQRDGAIKFDLLPDVDVLQMIEANRESKKLVSNFLSLHLPNRFAEQFTAQNFSNKPINHLTNLEIEHISETLNNWQVHFGKTEGWDKAEVTLGGIDTDEISSQTFEAKNAPGLYFIGEVLDVTGWLGGYNFQWAWSSAFAAGQFV